MSPDEPQITRDLANSIGWVRVTMSRCWKTVLATIAQLAIVASAIGPACASSSFTEFRGVDTVIISVTINALNAKALGLNSAKNFSQLAAHHIRDQLGPDLGARRVIAAELAAMARDEQQKKVLRLSLSLHGLSYGENIKFVSTTRLGVRKYGKVDNLKSEVFSYSPELYGFVDQASHKSNYEHIVKKLREHLDRFVVRALRASR